MSQSKYVLMIVCILKAIELTSVIQKMNKVISKTSELNFISMGSTSTAPGACIKANMVT